MGPLGSALRRHPAAHVQLHTAQGSEQQQARAPSFARGYTAAAVPGTCIGTPAAVQRRQWAWQPVHTLHAAVQARPMVSWARAVLRVRQRMLLTGRGPACPSARPCGA